LDDFSSKAYWENRYSKGKNSGAGSYNRLAEYKAEVINGFVKEKGIHKVVEWGCGDGNQLIYMHYDEYLGLDVSSTAIEICKNKFSEDPTKHFVLINDDLQLSRGYDLALSLDVIFHLTEDAVFKKYISDLFSVSNKYVCIYSSNYEEKTKPFIFARHVRHREFTVYVSEAIKDFELIAHIKNRYPYNILDRKNTSFADFYFYLKKT